MGMETLKNICKQHLLIPSLVKVIVEDFLEPALLPQSPRIGRHEYQSWLDQAQNHGGGIIVVVSSGKFKIMQVK